MHYPVTLKYMSVEILYLRIPTTKSWEYSHMTCDEDYTLHIVEKKVWTMED